MNKSIKIKWIKTGIICGFLTTIIFPAMAFLDLPVQFLLAIAASFGILLIISSIGLYYFISLHKNSVSLQLAVLFNIIAGSIVVMMFTVQLGLFSKGKVTEYEIPKEIKSYAYGLNNLTQLSLDVAWDIFISLGTILFALNMFSHPKLGRVIGITGILMGLGLLFINIYTFPLPPGEEGFIDLGPFTALWYLAVTLMITIGLKWANEKTGTVLFVQPDINSPVTK